MIRRIVYMINIERSVERRIKRANTDWWINEKAIVADNGKTYIAYCTDMGEIHIKEVDAKCSKAASIDVRICKLNCCYPDEHNAPSICVLESGHIMVAYTGHGSSNVLKFRITEKPYDLLSFGPEQHLEYDNTVTYAQLFENTIRGELWLFTRIGGITWGIRTSSDMGKTWSDPVIFLSVNLEVSKLGGLFYIDIRKLYLPTNVGHTERWFFALYGHPHNPVEHVIRSGLFDFNGNLLNMKDEVQDMKLFGEKHLLDLNSLDVVYRAPEGETVRLLDVSPTPPYRVAFSPFVVREPDTLYYRSATYHHGAWHLSEPICTGGEFLAPADQKDGSETYVGGMAYYYGIGLYQQGGANRRFIDTDRLYIARFDGKDRVLESYISEDYGATYHLEQVIRRIPGTGKANDTKIWRPVVPIHAQDNMPVYWHEGYYGAHTGGWHCDTVMYVEFDD